MSTKSKFCNRCGRPLETPSERAEHRCGSCRKKEAAAAKVETPELDKMLALKNERHTESIGEFLDWLSEQGVVLAERHHHTDECFEEMDGGYRERRCFYEESDLAPHYEPVERLLARYVGVDLAKVEEERRLLLKAIQAAQ